MGKLFTFGLLWYILGNPFLALLLLFLIAYFLDRRFIGLFPNAIRPFQIAARMRKLKRSLELNPHHTSDRLEMARLLMERKKYREALPHLEQCLKAISDSAQIRVDIGLCRLKIGDLDEGERWLQDALEREPRVQYGEPYLRLAEAFGPLDPDKAIDYLERFRSIHSSSCEGYYRLGRLYGKLDRVPESRDAYEEAIEIYRHLPRYQKRSQRAWALRSSFRLGLAPSRPRN
ncbi:tetratricopeptide repeat protein [Desmospora profundinema]|uniref:Tetratricopeptide (TPR) repeat protein n=1 Tax=Desmospora profundinema TaxID=1571184 RepID=A0ABU1ILT1_9BACL|nr:tetratricopeptide repeat protein [Desmospora profundinema]MDR6225737.1 tetratricopeptide (TPR) repeat protein [Desmospora profundinema]